MNTKKLDKTIAYTTATLAVDTIGGYMLTGRPLHEAIGIEFSDKILAVEIACLGIGIVYELANPYRPEQKY